jgi:hypothetical protein
MRVEPGKLKRRRAVGAAADARKAIGMGLLMTVVVIERSARLLWATAMLPAA